MTFFSFLGSLKLTKLFSRYMAISFSPPTHLTQVRKVLFCAARFHSHRQLFVRHKSFNANLSILATCAVITATQPLKNSFSCFGKFKVLRYDNYQLFKGEKLVNKKVLLALGLIGCTLGCLFLVGSFQPEKYRVERSVLSVAPPQAFFPLLNDLKRFSG